MNASWRIERAVADDAPAILDIQYQAYRQEARLYGGVTLPPLLETVDELRVAMETHVILKGLVDGVIVGSVRGREVDDTCYIGRLVVAPEHQGRGFGSALLAAIEETFVPVRRFELFTGHKSERNLGLYARRGYVEFRRQREDDAVTLVFMEKLG
ncbi:MAG: GNAT family N-acetyltransferase [Phycisphaerales bacterium]|nr:MAG: GNAT family N-acetyltransferase [Phycisphaerales bacterium]